MECLNIDFPTMGDLMKNIKEGNERVVCSA
jgi:hypothetical protein